MMNTILIAFFIFLYGLMIGSFLNVCAYRIPLKKSVVGPRSFCPNCKQSILFYDNIPLVSYLILGGKCRSCKQKISIQYVLVELFTGLMFVATYLLIGLNANLAIALTFVSIMILISAIDIKQQIIPNRIVIFGLIIGGLFFILTLFISEISLPPFKMSRELFPGYWSIVGFFSGGLLILTVAVVAKVVMKQDAMGGGDIKLAALMGMYLGPYVGVAIFIGFLIGSIVTLPLLMIGIIKRKQPVPFGPFLAAGAVLTLFFGPSLLKAYLGLLGL